MAALALALTLSLPAWAMPRPGEAFPSFSARDLRGQPHRSEELVGRPTLVVVITDRDAAGEMRRWFDTAKQQLPEGRGQHAAILSLDLPFYVSANMARGRARRQVPSQSWDNTWLDRDGDMAQALGLPESRQPFVFVLDEQGRVAASVHGTVDDAEAQQVWRAFWRMDR